MNRRTLGIVVGSILAVAAVFIITSTFYETTEVNVTVLWDDPQTILGPGLSDYNITTEEPAVISIYTLPESYRSQMIRSWSLEGQLSVHKVDSVHYFGSAKMLLRKDLIYMAKVPQPVLAGVVIDNWTMAEIRKGQSYNYLEIHSWAHRSIALKPAIYLYNTVSLPFNDTLSVTFPHGSATLTIPEIPLGPVITWAKFTVFPNSQISFGGTTYPYLFYEAATSKIDVTALQSGWVIQKSQGTWRINGQPVAVIEDFFRDALQDLGLFEQEIADFVDYWFEERPLFAEDGTYLLRQLPLAVINEHFKLATTRAYSTNRVFFTCSYLADPGFSYSLLPPRPTVSYATSPFLLHEWGIIMP